MTNPSHTVKTWQIDAKKYCPRLGFWSSTLDRLVLGFLWRRIGLLPVRECERMADGYCANCHADMYP